MTFAMMPPNWTIGTEKISGLTQPVALHYRAGRGWFTAYWITSRGEEGASHELEEKVPENVRANARELHRALNH